MPICIRKPRLGFLNRPCARGGIVREDSRRQCGGIAGNCRPKCNRERRSCTRLGSISQDPIGFAAGDANQYRYVGNSPTNWVDPNGLDKQLPPVIWDGETWEVVIDATGTSGGDISKANSLMRGIRPKFPGASSLKATWHHAKFNPNTGKTLMVLVEREAHAALNHSGAFADYLDWAANTIRKGNLDCLSDSQLMALARTLRDGALRTTGIRGRLNDAYKLSLKLLGNRGYTVKIAKDGSLVAELVAKKAGGRITGVVLRRVGNTIVAISVMYAAGSAYAKEGDIRDAGLAAARELVLADLVEGAHAVTCIPAANAIERTFMPKNRKVIRRNGVLIGPDGGILD
jgi:hypothetical protein